MTCEIDRTSCLRDKSSAMGSLKNCVGRRRSGSGLRQQELAERVGISRQSLSTLEAGSSVPSAALALRLARVLGCKVEDLFWTDDVSTRIEAELAQEGTGGAGNAGGAKANGNAEKTGSVEGAPVSLSPSLKKGRRAPAKGSMKSAGRARVVLASLGGRWVAHPLNPASDAAYMTSADGVLDDRPRKGSTLVPVTLLGDEITARQTLLCAGCAPAFGLLAARASRTGPGDRVLWLERSSTRALDLLAKGHVHVAGAHLYDDETREFNVPFVAQRLPDRAMQIFNLARWEVGLVTAAGNPKGIRGMKDLAQGRTTFVRRQEGAAAQELAVRLLRKEDLPTSLATDARLTAHGHGEVARLVALGVADTGMALATVARAHGLEFVPLAEERFDLIIAKEHASDPRIARLLETLSSRTFRREMESLGGHVARDAGKLIAETTARI
jgi:molybdate-binding protein/DNA-binding XRE family transcriptional regulator